MPDNPFAYKPLVEPKPLEDEGGNGRGISKKFIDYLQIFVMFLAVLVVTYLLFAIPTQVDGRSMEPTYQDNEVMLSNRLIQIAGGPDGIFPSYDYQRGDLVVFKKGEQPDLIKRIIGLPGETIEIRNQRVFINNEPLDESAYNDPISKPTIPGDFLRSGTPRVIPEGSYILLGDNRINSKDSRFSDIGFVTREEIKAAPFVVLFPLNAARLAR